mmetsp:Transcript_29440/g.59202  ORF Transcript_29440/g.59202 Transcript_29440/m.59202 type:complete len:261 (-) Transcript_29440:493-1275(-)
MGTVDCPQDTIDNIINVGVVTRTGSISELLQFQSTRDTVDELERGHIGTASWSVNSEKSKTRHIQVVEMMVCVGKELTRLLGCSIGRDWIIHILILREEGTLGSTIHTTRGGEHKVLDTKLVRQLHQMRGTTNIRVDVHKGILNRWPHTSTCRHVADPLRAFLLKQLEHKVLVTDITTIDSEAFVLGIHLTKTLKVVLLDTDIVVIIHFIHDDNIITSCKQLLGNVGTNKSSSTGNKNLLVSHVWRDSVGTGGTTFTLLR